MLESPLKPPRESGQGVVRQLGNHPNRAVEEYISQLERHRCVARGGPPTCRAGM